MSTITEKTVLITGCSAGGIGYAMAKSFASRGYHVFATARSAFNTGDLNTLPNVEVLELDVTIQSTIQACKAHVSEKTGGKLDVLVNNAGIELQSPLLDVDIEEARKVYDVNVWGTLAVTQAFAPLLVRAKGVVANQSSIDAALSMVWAGIFASSKAATMRLSETLRTELAPLDVSVVTLMTGSTDTPMFTKPAGKLDLPESSHYRGVEETAWKERMDHQKSASEVNVLAEQLVKDIIGGSSGIVWHGAFSAITRYGTWALPTSLLDSAINKPRGVGLIKRQ